VVTEDAVLAEAWLGAEQQHCRELVSLIDWCLGKAGMGPEGIEGLAVSLGPGSFTGLRIGLATAKALSLATGVPVVGVPSLEAVAAAAGPFPGPICAAVWSRPGEVYAALLAAGDGEDEWEYLLPTSALDPAVLAARLAQYGEEVLVTGEAARAVVEAAASAGALLKLASPVNRRLTASQVAYLGLRKLAAGRRDDPFRLQPLYLRPPGITRQKG
jgi:tRNA threonylcarbamoyladenosine biosynthesis protein TsaB